jgi:hypothetical protein
MSRRRSLPIADEASGRELESSLRYFAPATAYSLGDEVWVDVGPLTQAGHKAIICAESPYRCASIRCMDPAHFPMPQSVPAGMRLELSRAKLLPNSEKTFSDWMEWLHQEYEQLQQGLGVERTVFESTFLHKDDNGTSWIYHLQLIGDDSNGLDTSNPLGAKHQEFAMRSKESGWEELQPVFLIASPEILESMQRWLETQRQIPPVRGSGPVTSDF